MKRIYTYILQQRRFFLLSYCISLACMCQPSFGQVSGRTEGCGYSCDAQQKAVCFGDSFILNTFWTCNISPDHYDFEVYDGIIATTLLDDYRHKKYALSFAGPGNVMFRFNYQFYTITVYDPLKQAEPPAKTVFCKDDPPFTLNTSNSKYKLGSADVTLIDPSSYNTGSYILTEYSDKGRFGCAFTVGTLIKIEEACAPSQPTVVYPNPATGYVLVPADEASTIRLLDLYGNVLTERVADVKPTQLNLEDLPAGMFIVEFSGNEKKQNVKVVHL